MTSSLELKASWVGRKSKVKSPWRGQSRLSPPLSKDLGWRTRVSLDFLLARPLSAPRTFQELRALARILRSIQVEHHRLSAHGFSKDLCSFVHVVETAGRLCSRSQKARMTNRLRWWLTWLLTATMTIPTIGAASTLMNILERRI